MTPFTTKRLILRNWEERDRAFFHRINSDETVMQFFPMRRTRAEADAVMDIMRDEISRDGYGWTAAELAETGECVGLVGLHAAEVENVAPKGSVEIGWRLAPEFWGKGYVTEGATALLDFAFDELGVSEVLSLAVKDNHRSTAVMRRLAMTSNPADDFDHPRIPDIHPHLKRHVLYRLSRQTWRERVRPSTSSG